MKRKIFQLILLWISGVTLSAQTTEPMPALIERGLSRAREQALVMADSLMQHPGVLPKTFENGKLEYCSAQDWVCGFYLGELWHLVADASAEQTQNLRQKALLLTPRILPARHVTSHHDVGFMLYDGLSIAYSLTGDTAYYNAMLEGAGHLKNRFSPITGVTRSWNKKNNWTYPVIIDNMMNLELLCWATKVTGDTTFMHVANTHAQTTMRNHFRSDYSSFHVVAYDEHSGKVLERRTFQGLNDSSSWARGQAWAVYGYTMLYRETGNSSYLSHAKGVANYILSHPNLPADYIPYWDFSDTTDNAFRDASAAACMASALTELSTLDPNPQSAHRWLEAAQKMIRTLSSPTYLAQKGTNGGFLLMHSVGNMPKNREVDTPLSYADYYYVEALLRLKTILTPTAVQDRTYWIKQLTTIADPVIRNLANGTLRRNMPYEGSKGRQTAAYLEAGGRTILGLSAWLQLGEDSTAEGKLRGEYIRLTQNAIRQLVDPQSPDYTAFSYCYNSDRDKMNNQPLVDAAFLAQAILHAPKPLWTDLDDLTRQHLLTEFKRSRGIVPNESNWLLFTSIVEAFMLETTGSCDTLRLMYGVNRFLKEGWYKGDGVYGDGQEFHADYYNSFVIAPMLADICEVLIRHQMLTNDEYQEQIRRQTRYAAILERQIMPDGSFPVCGRSICYRYACFSHLSLTAWYHRLPTDVSPAQVRCAMTAMMKSINSNENLSPNGWLYLGFSGHQPSLAEDYINTGSLYLCTAAFSALGLQPTDMFWSAPYTQWTSVKAFCGTDIPADHAYKTKM